MNVLIEGLFFVLFASYVTAWVGFLVVGCRAERYPSVADEFRWGGKP